MFPKELEKELLKVQKPSRYVGGEYGEAKKDKTKALIRFAFCFPDVYEIGMSNLGMKILCGLLNKRDDCYCERVFAPWNDMGDLLQSKDIPLYALESGDALSEFDFLGFTLQHEMSYTNVLYMLSLAKLPLLAKDRAEDDPIVIGGGPCAYNPEPLCDFFDLFNIGEGEEMLNEIMDLYADCKKKGLSKKEFLRLATKINGVYVPSLYDVAYKDDGTVEAITPLYDDVPALIKKSAVGDLNAMFTHSCEPVPSLDAVHDRVMIEVFRGCFRGCRFCQAGFLNRPVRERSVESINEQAKKLCEFTGYDEISLSSLSISDYSKLEELVTNLVSWTDTKKINLSLPSMRVDNFNGELYKKISGTRGSGLTFAPEAGTQRLRDVINKNVTEEDILKMAREAFSVGKTNIKLYFMIGLPTETDEDIVGIAQLAKKVVDEFYKVEHAKGKGVNVTLSVAAFIPKPFTPFQWEAQNTVEEFKRKQQLLKDSITSRKITYNYHDSEVGMIESLFARGDRRLNKVLLRAFELGARFDAWDESFSLDVWKQALSETGIDYSFYTSRTRDFDEVLPWSHISCGVTEEFFKREAERARKGQTTPNCSEKCSGCGANNVTEGECICRR